MIFPVEGQITTVAGVNWPEMTAREEANTVIESEKQEEFVAEVNGWSDIIDIPQKRVRIYRNNRPLNRSISSAIDRSKLGFKGACCIQNSPALGT